jgi:eukaryotic-like serine/threonine-protein kinase
MALPPEVTVNLGNLSEDPSNQPPELSLSHWQNYKIEALLGSGGMARVYKAFDPKLSRYVALKFIKGDDEKLKKRMLREAKAQAQIEHDHVCKIYEVGEVEGKMYIAMQFIHGVTLQTLLHEITLDQKILLMQQIADAVQAAHRLGIIHRDIKPSNIMVERREDGSLRPYIMDFGLARDNTDSHLTATDAVMGTPEFMSPEQAMGDQDRIDRRTDVYGLGGTLYYLAAGRPPFQGSKLDVLVKVTSDDPVPLKKIVPAIPEDLDVIISRCLEKDASQRYESARALADDLKRYLDGEPIVAHRITLKYRITKKIKKNKTLSAVLAATFLLILASAIFSFASYWRAARQIEVARKFSQSVQPLDWMMRVAYMAPLHDIRKERATVLARIQEIQTMMNDAGAAGIGPGNFALGRGYLALQDYDRARLHLEKAWNSGYRGKEVTAALGLTLGVLFKRNLSEIDRITDPEIKKSRLTAVEKEYRDPAVRYLRSAAGIVSQSPEYGEALISYYEKKWNEALRLTRTSREKYPWLYEARMLEGDVYSRLGEQAYEEGNFHAAKNYFKKSSDSYASAENTARSDPALYESQCMLWRAIMETQLATGEDAAQSYAQSNGMCEKSIAANSDSATAYEALAQTAWRWGENQYELGQDPTAEFNKSIKISRKAQSLSPGHAHSYYSIGTAYSYIADFEISKGKDPGESLNQSIKNLLVAIQKDPGFVSSYTNLGVAYFSEGAYAMSQGRESKTFFLKSIESYEQARKISPRNIVAPANIANSFQNIGTDAMNSGNDPAPYFEKAVENYKKALEINPNHWLIHSNLASAYLLIVRDQLDHGKDPGETLEKIQTECATAEKLKPGTPYSAINSADAYVYHAEFLLSQNQNPLSSTQKAEERLKPVLNADFAEVYLALGDAKRLEAEYLLRGKKSPLAAIETGLGHYGKAFKINPAEQLVAIGRARLELLHATWMAMQKQSQQDALAAASKFSDQAIGLNPRSATAFLLKASANLGGAQWKKESKQDFADDLRQGFSAIEKSIQLNPNFAESYLVRAKLFLVDGKADEASKNFQRALAINPALAAQETETAVW